MPYYVSDNNLTPISKVKKANNMSSRANKIDLFAIQNICLQYKIFLSALLKI